MLNEAQTCNGDVPPLNPPPNLRVRFAPPYRLPKLSFSSRSLRFYPSATNRK